MSAGAGQEPIARRERAVGIREAAAAVREADLAVREARAAARDVDRAERHGVDQAILDGADQRDQEAEVRDETADRRDSAASLAAFLADGSAADFGAALRQLRFAAVDRIDAKEDRTCAEQDRTDLTDTDTSE